MKNKLDVLGFSIFKNYLSKKDSIDLFNTFQNYCKFYCPNLFTDSYKNKWLDVNFNNQLIKLRKDNPKIFAAIYNSFARSSAMYQFCYDSELNKLAADILEEDKENLGVRDPVLRIDVPSDKRNTYGWHQDSAYSKLHTNSKNEIIFWIPLVNTTKKNGTLIVKPKSHIINKNVSYLKSNGGKYTSKQFLIKERFLKKFKSSHINVKANSVLASYANLFHKSGFNSSSKIRFTIIVRFYKILVNDYIHYRKNIKDIKKYSRY
tara:strand:+ start:99 stop:884 length:786 start_codon:yes stop_codon:yes gene_type:complete